MGQHWTPCPRRKYADARESDGSPHGFVAVEDGDGAVAADHAAAVAAAANCAVGICLPWLLAYISGGQIHRSSSYVGSAGGFDQTFRKGCARLEKQVSVKGMGFRSHRASVNCW